MRNFPWLADDGWPYPDSSADVTDHSADLDDDMVMIRSKSGHVLDGLNDLERQVISAHYGLNGHAPRTMKQLRSDLGLSRSEIREALGSGLQKLRTNLSG